MNDRYLVTWLAPAFSSEEGEVELDGVWYVMNERRFDRLEDASDWAHRVDVWEQCKSYQLFRIEYQLMESRQR